MSSRFPSLNLYYVNYVFKVCRDSHSPESHLGLGNKNIDLVQNLEKLPLLTLTNSHTFSIHNSLDEQCQVLAMAPAECGHPYGHKFRDSTSSAEMKQFNKASPGGEGQTVTYTCEDYVTCPCLRHLYMHALPLRHLYMHTHLPSFVCRHYIY